MFLPDEFSSNYNNHSHQNSYFIDKFNVKRKIRYNNVIWFYLSCGLFGKAKHLYYFIQAAI